VNIRGFLQNFGVDLLAHMIFRWQIGSAENLVTKVMDCSSAIEKMWYRV